MCNTYREVLIIAGLIFCLFSSVYAYSGGSGIGTDPYKIGTVSDWQQLMNTEADWDRCFIMTADVNLQGIELTPVGLFFGVFDGNGHIIRNASINTVDFNNVGLFGEVDGRIFNLVIEDANIIGSCHVGVLAGYIYGTVTGCCATGTVNGDDYVGGLVGTSWCGTINNCYAACQVSGSEAIGGLVGANGCGISGTGGTIANCYAAGTVNGVESVGGLVGNNQDTITDCYATGIVNGEYRVGGLAGWNWDIGTIMGCYATGTVTGYAYYAGGLVGDNQEIITNCYASGTVNGEYCVGGLTGENDSGTITDCYATGTVSGDVGVGGLVGYTYYGSIANCYSTSAVDGNDCVGGLAGLVNSSISSCLSTGVVTGSFGVGGLVGISGYNGSLTNCYSTGAVSGSGDNIGGLTGLINGSITNCYSTADVSGNHYDVGGLVGESYEGTITDCYSTGAASGHSYVGGLAGRNTFGTITNCYSTGTVDGNNLIGGLVGDNYDQNDINASFWDMETSGKMTSAGGTGKTTAEMQDIDTFLNAGWDLDYDDGDPADWFIQIDEYPILVWQISPADIYTDGRNNFRDFAIFAQYWKRDDCAVYNYYCDGADMDLNGHVDIDDLIEFISYWLESGIYN